MANLQLPPSVRDLRGQAIEAIVNRLAQIDLSPLLVYRIDSVPASALPWLGWQFDLLSPLWQLLAPAGSSLDGEADAARRSLIKTGIALHRMRGTPAAIKTALANLGWSNVTIQEGQHSWGGVSWPANEGWAVCRVLIFTGSTETIPEWDSTGATLYFAPDIVSYNGLYFQADAPVPAGLPPQYASIEDVPNLDTLTNVDLLIPYPWYLYLLPAPLAVETVPLGASDEQEIAAVFNFFKPERCWLDSVWFALPNMVDVAPAPADILTIAGIAEFGSDSAPAPAEGALTIAVALGGYIDDYPPIAPLQNKHYFQKGHHQGANQPIVADGPIVIDGVIDGTSS